MHWTTIEFRVEPNLERVEEAALVLHISISEREGNLIGDYRLWRGVLFGPPTSDLLKMASTSLEPNVARKLLEAVGSVKASACPKFEVGLHPINYRLEIHSGFNSAQFAWQEELPEQWRELESVIALIRSVAENAKSSGA